MYDTSHMFHSKNIKELMEREFLRSKKKKEQNGKHLNMI